MTQPILCVEDNLHIGRPLVTLLGDGSGLKLAIVAEICNRHGTPLELMSDEHDTTATFELSAACWK